MQKSLKSGTKGLIRHQSTDAADCSEYRSHCLLPTLWPADSKAKSFWNRKSCDIPLSNGEETVFLAATVPQLLSINYDHRTPFRTALMSTDTNLPDLLCITWPNTQCKHHVISEHHYSTSNFKFCVHVLWSQCKVLRLNFSLTAFVFICCYNRSLLIGLFIFVCCLFHTAHTPKIAAPAPPPFTWIHVYSCKH